MSEPQGVNFILVGGVADRVSNQPGPPKKKPKDDPFDEFVGMLVLVCFAVYLALQALPSSVFFTISLLALYVLSEVKASGLSRYRSDPSLKNEFKIALIKNIYSALCCLAIGLGVLTLLQAAINNFSGNGIGAIFRLKVILSEYHKILDNALGLRLLIYSLPFVSLLAFFLGQSSILGAYLKIRNWLAKIALVLFTISSFALFVNVQTQINEKNWVNQYQSKVEAQRKELTRLSLDIVALAWLKQQIDKIDEQDKRYITETVRLASNDQSSKKITLRFAVEVGVSILSTEERRGVRYGEPRAPTSHQSEYLHEETRRFQERAQHITEVKKARALSLEIATTAIEALFPSSKSPLPKVFTSALISTVTESVVRRVISSEFVKASIIASALVHGVKAEIPLNLNERVLKELNKTTIRSSEGQRIIVDPPRTVEIIIERFGQIEGYGVEREAFERVERRSKPPNYRAGNYSSPSRSKAQVRRGGGKP